MSFVSEPIIQRCPRCNTTSVEPLFRIKAEVDVERIYTVYECKKCGLKFDVRDMEE